MKLARWKFGKCLAVCIVIVGGMFHHDACCVNASFQKSLNNRFKALKNKNSSKTQQKSNRRKHFELLKKVENFFNSLKTIRADFIEENSSGNNKIRGKFLLKRRPAMLKMDSPKRRIIVKDYKAEYYDKELKEKSVISVYSYPLSFLLDPIINLSENVKIVFHKENSREMRVAFRKKDDKKEEKGVVLLVFSIKPSMKLECWEIYRNSKAIGRERPIRVRLVNQKMNDKMYNTEF